MPTRLPVKAGHTRILMPRPDGGSDLIEVPIDSDLHRAAVGLPRRNQPPVPAGGPSMSFTEALFYRRSYGADAVLPPDMRDFTLPELEARADEEQRPAREKRQAAEAAARIDAARHSITRALLSGAPKRRTPSRLRACFLRQLERWGTVSQAAAAVELDRRTIHRWRERDPAFDARCRAALDRRAEKFEDEIIERARTPHVRPFFYAGRKVGEVATYKDALLLKLIGHENARRRAGPADPSAVASAVVSAMTPVLRAEMSRIVGQPESGENPG